MNWLIRIILSLNIFLLCGSFTSSCPLSGAELTASNFSQELATPGNYSPFTGASARLKPQHKNKHSRNYLATEFEDDSNESGAYKKHVSKANYLAAFFYANNHSYHSYTVNSTLLPGKLTTTFVSNKLYLLIQVFRI